MLVVMRHSIRTMALLAPAVLIVGVNHALAEHWGKAWGSVLASLAPEADAPRGESNAGAQRLPAARPEPSSASPRAELAPEISQNAAKRAAPPRRSRQGHRSGEGVVDANPSRGLRIDRDVVLELANRGVRPRGVFVPKRSEQPAGLALYGVGALGIGMQDGDILTHINGVPAASAGQVVSAVIAARGARASVIAGRFWRKGEFWQLAVEQPYLDPPAATVAGTSRAQSGNSDARAR